LNNEEKNIEVEIKQEKAIKPKRKFNFKKLKYGSLSIIIMVIVVAVVVLVNVIVTVAANSIDMNTDLTHGDFYEISPETIDYISKLTQDVSITIMSDELSLTSQENIYYKQVVEILKKYPMYSDHITTEFVNLTLTPNYINKYDDIYAGEIITGDIVVQSGNRIKVSTFNSLFTTEMNYQTFQQAIAGSNAEQVITSAIMYVTDLDPKHAYIADVPMAESSTATNIQSLLSGNGYDVDLWSPADAIPDDCDLLIVDAPLTDFDEATIKKIYDFMENGGNYGRNMIYLANTNQKDMTNINNYISEWGLSIESGSVIGETDNENILSSLSSFYIKTQITPNDYSANVANMDLPVALYYSAPIDFLFSNMSNVRTYDLLSTAPTSVKITTEMMMSGEQISVADLTKSSYSVMALADKYAFVENEQVKSNLLVVGGSDMFDSSITQASYYNNADYFLSVVNTMTGKSGGINLTTKVNQSITFPMDMNKFTTAQVIFLYVLPIAVLLAGGAVLLIRRHK
jgi:hypothetical protein